MEAFMTKKRRHATLQAPTEADEDSTEVKLVFLESLHPGLPQEVLLEALFSSNGSVDLASSNLSGDTTTTPPPPKRHRSIGYQSSLSTYAPTSDATSPLRPLTKKGKTLHLYSPDDVETHTPCSIIHNFLPPSLADSLLLELAADAPTYWRGKFQLFDRTVESPHTFCFYVKDEAAVAEQRRDYYYNGAAMPDIRPLLPRMRDVAPLVDRAVNAEVQRRVREYYPRGEKLRYQSMEAFEGNAAFVNVYDGGRESVGYHTDELTYLGPRAVIGSLSLGVAREFRVRRIVPRENKEDKEGDDAAADTQGQVAIHLPHNSLLVMHAEMQEEWKHSIAPAPAIDPHPLAGNKRINVTYRHYKESMHPRHTPKCRCGIPVTLRCVMRSEINRGRYMWMCHVGYQPGQKGCGYFEWADFDDDGRPPWAKERVEKIGQLGKVQTRGLDLRCP